VESKDYTDFLHSAPSSLSYKSRKWDLAAETPKSTINRLAHKSAGNTNQCVSLLEHQSSYTSELYFFDDKWLGIVFLCEGFCEEPLSQLDTISTAETW